jgi:hypothetical protein
MALDYEQLDAITRDHVVPSLTDNIFDQTPVLQMLKGKAKTISGGTGIRVPIEYATTTSTGWYTKFDTLLTEPNEVFTAVLYNWAHGYVNMTLAKTDLLANNGPEQIVSLLYSQKKNAEKTLAKTMTSALFSETSNSKAIQGIPLMVDDSASTDYAGINATDFSGWASSIDSSTTTMTIPVLQGKFGDCSDGNDVPTLIIMNQDNFDKYYELLEVKPDFRVQDKNNKLKFQGATIVVDKASNGTGSGTQDNHVTYLNENYITFFINKKNNFVVGKWQQPTNQEAIISRITWSGQLTTSNRRRHGALEAIDPAL